MKILRAIIFIFICGISQLTYAQDRFDTIQIKLNDLASTSAPGLNQKVDFSVSGTSIQDFVRAIAETNELNVSVDPSLNITIINNFNGEKAGTIFLFLCKEYDLDISFVGSIMSFKKYEQKIVVVETDKQRDLIVEYEAARDKFTIDLDDHTLGEVAKTITKVTGKNVVVPSSLRQRKMNGYLQGLSFDAAIDKLAFANELQSEKAEDGTYIIKAKPKNDGKSQFTDRPQIGKLNLGKYRLNVKKGRDGQKRITFQANNAPIVDVLHAVSEEAEMSYMLYSEPSGNTTMNVVDVTYPEFLTMLLQGSDHTFRQDSSLFMIGERSLEGLRATRVVQLEYRSVDEMIELIPTELKNNVQISEFREQNSIVLSGGNPEINEIIQFLDTVDKHVPVVMIEVIILDIRKNKTVKTGLRAGLLAPGDSSVSQGSILGPDGVDFNFSSRAVNRLLDVITAGSPIQLGRVTPSFYLGLSALDAKDYANVRQMPKLSTLNGHPANMRIGTSRYYSQQTQNVVGSVSPVVTTTQQFNQVNANLAIDINPVVSGDDQVTLNINVELSDFLGNPPPNAPPPSATSQFNSNIRVRNEEMVVLGGLERYEKSDRSSGIPVLSRIPVLKWIFSSKEKNKNKTISLIFIKPTIIY